MTPQFKVIAIVLFLTGLIGFHAYQLKKSDQAGYERARLEMLEDFQRDLDAAMEAKRIELEIAVEKRDKWKAKAIELQNRKPKTITVREVEEIVKVNNDCRRIINIDKLFNKKLQNFTD